MSNNFTHFNCSRCHKPSYLPFWLDPDRPRYCRECYYINLAEEKEKNNLMLMINSDYLYGQRIKACDRFLQLEPDSELVKAKRIEIITTNIPIIIKHGERSRTSGSLKVALADCALILTADPGNLDAVTLYEETRDELIKELLQEVNTLVNSGSLRKALEKNEEVLRLAPDDSELKQSVRKASLKIHSVLDSERRKEDSARQDKYDKINYIP